MHLPQEFIDYTSHLFGEERWQKFLVSFDEEPPVSIRLNPFKGIGNRKEVIGNREEVIGNRKEVIGNRKEVIGNRKEVIGNRKEVSGNLLFPIPYSLSPNTQHPTPIPWCRNAFWLSERPLFTLDPLLHAGAYYVQEAGSMFLDTVLRQYAGEEPVTMLDLCAAPGGKSTLARAALPEGSVLFSNEPDRKRANILVENLQKQGHPGVRITNCFARDYARSRQMFDIILTDVPCSGEGMFRRDYGAIDEWSLQNVMKCAELQRSIVSDIWPCLRPGGLFIYSTCTFNTHEDEENVRWIMENLGADILPVDTEAGWGITGSLLEGFTHPVYRFIPGTTRSEGLFMAVLRKHGSSPKVKPSTTKLRLLYDGKPQGEQKGKDIIPAHAEAISIAFDRDKYPMVELSLDDARRYLHREAITLPADTPRGYVVVTYHEYPLGFMKNIGNRANNLYPKEWAIRKL